MTKVAADMVAFGRLRGIDLTPYYSEGNALFLNRGRGIFFWPKYDGIGYNMQGPIMALPNEFNESASAFYGMWHESGSLPDLEHAFEFLVAWLVEYKEVDDLPDAGRNRHRWGIG